MAKKPAKKPHGRPSKRTPAVDKKVIDGLRKGIPLTVICDDPDMPCDDTVRRWAEKDEQFLRDIARARDAGHDRIAQEALDIADATENDTLKTENGDKPNTEWITRSRLRVETRLKLLAKWNPKKYGDRIDVTSGGEKIQSESDEVSKFSRLAAMIADKQTQGLLPDLSEADE